MTDRCAAESETALLAAVVGSVSDAVVTADRKSRILTLNAAAEALFGVRGEDVVGRPVVDALVHPDDHARAREWARRLSTGARLPHLVHARMRRADGAGFEGELSLFPVHGHSGELLGMAGIARDVTARVAAEARAATMRAVVDAAAEAIIGIDEAGSVNLFSPSAERIFGWRADEVLGRPAAVLVAEHRLDRARAMRDEVLAGGTIHRETVVRHKDGSLVDAYLTASAVRGAGGRPEGMALTVLDVSERRRNQFLLERIVDHAPNVIAVKDRDGVYRLLNAHGRALGLRTGATDDELFDEASAELLRRQDREVLDAVAPVTYEDELPMPDGEMRCFVTTKFPIAGPAGQLDGVGLIAADVTDIRRAEGDRALLAALVEAAPDGIVTQDRHGRITSWNPGAEALFGLTAEEALGRPYAETVVPEEERDVYSGHLEAVRAGGRLTTRTKRMRADGTVFPAEVAAAPLATAEGRRTGSLAIVRDITELAEAERKLRERAAALERSNSDLERFAYAASHDLQEPLRSIKLSATTLLEAAAARLDPDERELLAHINDAADRLSEQVRGLMEVAQVALGERAEHLAPIEIPLTDALNALRAAATAAEAQIDVRRPLPEAPVPRSELALVLQNLIANAIKYHRPGVPPRITVAATAEPETVELRITDNGVGLSEADLARVFGAFERVQPDVPGTGLGLAVARRMVERHGGTISAASAGPGHGAEFTVRLPLDRRWGTPLS